MKKMIFFAFTLVSILNADMVKAIDDKIVISINNDKNITMLKGAWREIPKNCMVRLVGGKGRAEVTYDNGNSKILLASKGISEINTTVLSTESYLTQGKKFLLALIAVNETSQNGISKRGVDKKVIISDFTLAKSSQFLAVGPLDFSMKPLKFDIYRNESNLPVASFTSKGKEGYFFIPKDLIKDYDDYTISNSLNEVKVKGKIIFER